MNFLRSVQAVAGASGDEPIDWSAAAEAARAATDPGTLDLSPGEQAAYAADVRDARREVRSTAALAFDVPDVVEIQNRHHWMDANVETFERVLSPLDLGSGQASGEGEHRLENVRRTPPMAPVPGVARTINTGTMSVMLAFLGRNVLGQYDPLLLADAPTEDHALYFVHPNILDAAESLDVDLDRFRRWIAFHEVTHAAEFGAAPWLTSHLEGRMEAGIASLRDGSFDRATFRELDAAMTVVEGYAELLMDHAFDDEYDDLRRKLDERRRGRGPLQRLLRRLLGLGLKRRQYERGKAFFEHVVSARGLDAAGRVWDGPAYLPTNEELDSPTRWIDRIDP